MTAHAARARDDGLGFRWAFWQVLLWAAGFGAALAGGVVLVAVIVSGGSTDAVMWVSIALWALVLGGAAGVVMAVLALILRALAHGGAPVPLLRWLLGIAAALATSAVLVWLTGGGADSPLVPVAFVALGAGIGWAAQHLTFARRRAGAAA